MTQMNLARRRPGMTHDDHVRHWQTTHAELVLRSPGISGYIQCESLDPDSEFDGVPITEFPDAEANAVFVASPEFREQFERDAPLFVDMSYIRGIALGEQIEMTLDGA